MPLAKPLIIPILVANLTAEFPFLRKVLYFELFSLRIINNNENND